MTFFAITNAGVAQNSCIHTATLSHILSGYSLFRAANAGIESRVLVLFGYAQTALNAVATFEIRPHECDKGLLPTILLWVHLYPLIFTNGCIALVLIGNHTLNGSFNLESEKLLLCMLKGGGALLLNSRMFRTRLVELLAPPLEFALTICIICLYRLQSSSRCLNHIYKKSAFKIGRSFHEV